MKRPVSLIAACIVLVIAFLYLLITIIGALQDDRVRSCEDRGGHLYTRQAGKIAYYKCINDNDEVIDA